MVLIISSECSRDIKRLQGDGSLASFQSCFLLLVSLLSLTMMATVKVWPFFLKLNRIANTKIGCQAQSRSGFLTVLEGAGSVGG